MKKRHIAFATGQDRQLFEHAMGRPDGITLSDALELLFLGASVHLPESKLVDFSEADGGHVVVFKGIWSPVLARMRAQDEFGGMDLDVKYVWLRTSLDGCMDYDYRTVNGTPGKGGSYKATIVSEEGMSHCYSVPVVLDPLRLIVSAEIAEEWDAFTRREI